jgi:hypothetical protein
MGGGRRVGEGLLADDGAGGLVVDVEVSGRVGQDVHRLYNGAAVEGENRAGQRVWRGLVAYVQRLVIFIFRIDVYGQDRPEDLFGHQFGFGRPR